MEINSDFRRWKRAASSEPGDAEDDGDARGFLSFGKIKVQRDHSDSQKLSNFLLASDQREVAGDPRAAQPRSKCIFRSEDDATRRAEVLHD